MNFNENISLKPYHTFKIDVLTRYFLRFSTVEELKDCLYTLPTQQMLILGGGSNLLFTKNFDGTVLQNNLKGIEFLKEDEDHVYIKVQAGENWHEFVQYCLLHNYAGIENLSLIPGNVGASPIQNIGAYGVEIKDVLYELEAYHKETHVITSFKNCDCEFGYRDSVFKKKFRGQFVILNVTFRLHKKPNFKTSYGVIEKELELMSVKDLTIQAISEAVIRIRSSKLPNPALIGNAGSFFKNPVIPNKQFEQLKMDFPGIPGYPGNESETKVAAGWLIEQCGWKGYRKGDAGCFMKQALVLVNYGNASGMDILDLSNSIIKSVFDKFSIQLEREVNIF